MHTRTHTHAHAHMHTHMRAHTHTHTHTCTYVLSEPQFDHGTLSGGRIIHLLHPSIRPGRGEVNQLTLCHVTPGNKASWLDAVSLKITAHTCNACGWSATLCMCHRCWHYWRWDPEEVEPRLRNSRKYLEKWSLSSILDFIFQKDCGIMKGGANIMNPLETCTQLFLLPTVYSTSEVSQPLNYLVERYFVHRQTGTTNCLIPLVHMHAG